MPTYDFRCPQGHDFERFFGRISEAPSELACPDCGQIAHRRISGGAGLIFKGSGFYITDYGKDGKKDQRAASHAGGGSKHHDHKGGGSDGKGGDGKAGESPGGAAAAAPSGGTAGGSNGGSSAGDKGGASATSTATTPSRPTVGE